MSRLGQNARFSQFHADVPGFHTQVRTDLQSVQEPLASDFFDPWSVDGPESLAEDFPKPLGLFVQFFVLQDLQGLHGDFAGKRVAAVGGAVLAGLDAQHHFAISQHGRDRQHASGEGFTQDHDVGTYLFVVAGQHSTGAAESGLHFVGYHQHVVLVADAANFFQVAFARHLHAGLALNRFEHESADVGMGEGLFKGRYVVVRYHVKPRHVGSESVLTGGVGGGADGGQGTAPEVALDKHDSGLLVGNVLVQIAPATS